VKTLRIMGCSPQRLRISLSGGMVRNQAVSKEGNRFLRTVRPAM
jgi:hypothetical protein